jgi:carboxyl-terminal processing protease
MQPGQRLTTIIAALLLIAGGPLPAPTNLDLEAGASGEPPTGWRLSSATQASGYDAVVSSEDPQGGKLSARLFRSGRGATDAPNFGSMNQTIDAAPYRGHRIRFRAAVRARPATGGWAGLWIRVDRQGDRRGAFENMKERPIASTDWTFYEVGGVVAPDAMTIIFGLLLSGDGEASIDTASLEDLGPVDLAPHEAAKTYLDEALDRLEREHINSAKVDWKTLRTEAYLAAAGATTPAQTHDAIRRTIQALGERHTFLMPPRPASAPTAAPRALPHGAMIGKHVAMIALPRLMRDLADPRDDGAPYQSAIETFVTQAHASGACGWIVDLRGHGGGDMWPGMRGLAPLLGPGPHGTFVSAKGRTPWPVLPAAPSRSTAPIAVLVGPRTGSSGEMITIAFEGRPLTRFFGEPTAGLTTANSARPLSDGAVLAVTSAYVEDRTGHRYDGPILPDETAPGQEAQARALAWLKAQGCD